MAVTPDRISPPLKSTFGLSMSTRIPDTNLLMAYATDWLLEIKPKTESYLPLIKPKT